jgi:hypothetical protein
VTDVSVAIVQQSPAVLDLATSVRRAADLVTDARTITARLDTAARYNEMHELDAAGHYNRPDVFTLTVRRERLDSGVHFSAGAAGGTDRGLPEPGTDAGHFASHGADASGAPR